MRGGGGVEELLGLSGACAQLLLEFSSLSLRLVVILYHHYHSYRGRIGSRGRKRERMRGRIQNHSHLASDADCSIIHTLGVHVCGWLVIKRH